SLLSMPLPGTKHAPPKFKGDHAQIRQFIWLYSRLCDENNVQSGNDRCRGITQYCSRGVAEFIEALDSYVRGNWNRLQADLLKYYDAELYDNRFMKKDLVTFVKKTKSRRMGDMKSWRRYTRGFIKIAGWLVRRGKLTDREYNIYFWSGIGRGLRAKIESRLIAANPNRDRAQPYSMEEVNDVTEGILQRDTFDQELEDSDDDVGTDWLGESDSDDDTSTDEDVRYGGHSARSSSHKKKKGGKKKRVRFPDSDSDEPTRPAKRRESRGKNKARGEQDKVEDMIKQMSSMSVHDSNYALVYYRALKLDNTIATIVPPP
ncbi:hypothetical protein BV25DRAFT_1766343, partial [Artomyces pyxidatus]